MSDFPPPETSGGKRLRKRGKTLSMSSTQQRVSAKRQLDSSWEETLRGKEDEEGEREKGWGKEGVKR